MGTLIKFFIGPIAGPLFGVISLVLLVGGGGLYVAHRIEVSNLNSTIKERDGTIKALQTEVADGHADLAICRANTKTLGDQLDKVNGAVAGLGAMTAQLAATMRSVGSNAAKGQLDVQSRITNFLAQMPIPGVTSCDAAFSVLKGPLP